MKGPSLEAIRKFKEAQEKKKVQEDERKIQEKLSTLNHRAAQGDRKAKSTLIKIEKLEKEKTLVDNITRNQIPNKISRPSSSKQIKQNGVKTTRGLAPKPKASEFNFEDLMKMAKKNNNQMGKPESAPAPAEQPAAAVIKKKVRTEPRLIVNKPQQLQQKIAASPRLPPKGPSQPVPTKAMVATSYNKLINKSIPTPSRPLAPEPARRLDGCPRKNLNPTNVVRGPNKFVGDNGMSADEIRHQRQMAIRMAVARHKAKLNQRNNYYDHEEEEEEDDYEEDYDDLDDFVVDEEEDEDQEEELRKTIRSVFKYDKRRCDRREEELDRQYRAIGRVNTFEDLEREERRASRLAAIEDAEAQREEDERKRKKAKLKKHS